MAIRKRAMPDLENFPRKPRAWLEANCPPELRKPMTSDEDTFWGGRHAKFSSEPQRVWFERMRDRGWTGPHWAQEYGGRGLEGAVGTLHLPAMGARGVPPPLSSVRISIARTAL